MILRLPASGTLGCVDVLLREEAEVAINWSGGMHRARADMAIEGCFVNDVVLSVLALLEKFDRIMVVNLGHEHPDAFEKRILHYEPRAFYKFSRRPGSALRDGHNVAA